MNPAEPFPLYIPGEARRAFRSDDATRRFARVAQLEPGAHVLVLGADAGPVLTLVRELGCTLVVADAEEAPLAALREQLTPEELGDKVELRRVDLNALHFPPGAFEAILIPGRVLSPLTQSLSSLRALLAVQGRIGLVYPARVGRQAPPEVLGFWQNRLGAPLLMLRELLQVLESCGYEPRAAESLTREELDALYEDAEPRLADMPSAEAEVLREELALHRRQEGRVVATYAFLVGRRKEPGERPPAAYDRG